MERASEQQFPIIYQLPIPMESRIRFVSETDPEIYHRYDVEKAEVEKEDIEGEGTDNPIQSELHQTAEILCKLSDSPTIHQSAASDLLSFLTEADRYTVHPVYPPMSFPTQGMGIISFPSSYPTFIINSYPPPPATKTIATTTNFEVTPSISDEEWIALTSPELPRPLDINACGSPVVEEFLQTYLPLDTPAEDRQGWYEFLCEDGGNEDCWTKFLGSDSGAEIYHEWLEGSGYQENC